MTGNLVSPELANEPLRVNPELVRTPLPTREGCATPVDICLLLDAAFVFLLSLSNLNVTDLVLGAAILFKGGNPIDVPTRLVLVTGSTLALSSLDVSSM